MIQVNEKILEKKFKKALNIEIHFYFQQYIR